MKKCNHILTALLIVFTTAVTANTVCNDSLVTVLTINGNGVDGIIPALLLKELEEKSEEKTANLFDFMTGVSTSTILIAMLSTPDTKGSPKYSADDLISMLRTKSKLVLSATLWHKITSLFGLINSEYQPTEMEKLAEHYFDNISISQLLSQVTLLGYDVSNKGLIAFSNWGKQEPYMPYYKVKDVVLGTAATMPYFPPKSLVNGQGIVEHRIIDAVLIMNNPVAVAFLYAYNQCPNAQHYLIVSMDHERYPKLKFQTSDWGIVQWVPYSFTTAMMGEMRTSNVLMLKMAELLNEHNSKDKLPRVLFVRLSPKLSAEDNEPMDPSAEHIRILENMSISYIQKKQPQLNCLVQLLKNRSGSTLSNVCLDLLKNEHPLSAGLWKAIEG